MMHTAKRGVNGYMSIAVLEYWAVGAIKLGADKIRHSTRAFWNFAAGTARRPVE
jgi:hypothetical protein